MIDFSMYDAKKPEIFAVKCPQCGRLDYPSPMICKGCGTRRDPSGIKAPDWEKIAMEGSCKLLAWTKVYALPDGYEKPFLMFGIVEFQNGLRAAGRLEAKEVQTGMALDAQVEVSDERGPEVNIFFFREP